MIVGRKIRDRERLPQDSGQATLEMILLLVIGMFIALGAIYRFNTAFRQYTIDMYGTYYRCLLETGELPGVGSVCRDRNARFAIASGRELVRNVPGSAGVGGGAAGGGGAGGGSGSGGNNSGQNAGSSGGKGSGGSGSGSGSGGSSEVVGGSGQTSGGGSGSVVGRLRQLGRQRSTAVAQVGEKSAGDDDGSSGAAGAISAVGSRATSDSLRRAQTKMEFKMDGSSAPDSGRAAVSAVTASSKTTKPSDRGGDSLRPRKTVENTDRKPAEALKEDKGGGLEFGRLFRIFIIIAIIVAIAVFLGGQVLQISKSGEK